MEMNGPKKGGISFFRNFCKMPTLLVKNRQKRISINIELTTAIFGGQNF
jgi:hypothetical protein